MLGCQHIWQVEVAAALHCTHVTSTVFAGQARCQAPQTLSLTERLSAAPINPGRDTRLQCFETCIFCKHNVLQLINCIQLSNSSESVLLSSAGVPAGMQCWAQRDQLHYQSHTDVNYSRSRRSCWPLVNAALNCLHTAVDGLSTDHIPTLRFYLRPAVA